MTDRDRGLALLQGASEYSALDFEVIALLEEVKHAVIFPKIRKEWRELLIGYKEDPKKTRKKWAQQNLAAGLLGIWELAKLSESRDGQKDGLGDFAWGTEDFNEDELYELLTSYGHYLFNSYYYTLLTEFGDEGLVPVIPGETRPSSDQGQKALSKFIQSSKLPLHLNETYLDTYSTLHLPLRAGITPRYLQLYHTGNQLGPKSWRVANFLGDLGILEKREDYFHRHLCALIIILGERGDRQGAFILTSAIPDALSEHDMTRLNDVISTTWDFAPLGNIHRDMTRTIRSTKSHLEWIGQSDHANLQGQEEEQLQTIIQQSLASMGPDGAYILRGAFYDDDRRLCQLAAMNSEGIQRVLECQFPTSPWLDPETIRPVGLNSEKVSIDVAQLEDLCRMFEDLSSPGEDKSRLRIEAFARLTKRDSWRGILNAIFPEADKEGWTVASLTPDAHLVSDDDNQKGRMLIFRDPSVEENQREADLVDLTEFKRWAHRALQKSELRGSRNSELAHLQREWNRYQGRTKRGLDSEYTGSAREPLRNLRNIFDRAAIRGLLVLVGYDTYVPQFLQKGMEETKEQAKKRAAFREAFCSYPSFWLFESVCHTFTEDFEILPLQLEQNSGVTTHPFRWVPKDEIGYSVIRSGEPSVDTLVATAFTYMGVPIREWLESNDSSPEYELWRIPDQESQLQGWVNTRYRDYVRDCLKRGEEYEPIKRALQSSDTEFRVASIEIEQFDSDVVEMKVELEGVAQPEQIKWQKNSTVDFAFCAMAGESLCRKHAAVFSIPSKTKPNGLHVETIQANGQEVVRDEDSGFMKALAQTLYERSQTLRWGVQRGLLSKFILFNHEARNGIEMINRLFRVPLNQSLSATQGRMLRLLNRFLRTPLTQQRNNNYDTLLEEVETAKVGASILELSFASVLGSPPLVPLLDINPRVDPSRYLHEVIKLGVARGVSELTTKSNDSLTASSARSLITNLTNSIVSNMEIELHHKTLAHGGPAKWKSQEIIVVLVSNAIKHMLSYLLRHLDGPQELVALPPEFWGQAIRFRLDANTNTLTTENIGPPRDIEFFHSQFQERAGKSTPGTYAVLQTTVEDTEAWGLGSGTIELGVKKIGEARLPSKLISERAQSRLAMSHLFMVRVHLPQHFLEETHHATQTSTKTDPSSSV
jgi:hypothetical protein